MLIKTLKATRNWGAEFIFYVAAPYYMLKILHVNKGHRGGLQKHWKKHECGIVLEGKMIIRTKATSGLLSERIVSKGGFFGFVPGLIHQEEAVTDVWILEVSSLHFNDRLRFDMKDNPENDLRSTTESQVVTIFSCDQLGSLERYGFSEVDLDATDLLGSLLQFQSNQD
jgi:hypothetical protein